MVFNPYYKKRVDPYGSQNCGATRKSSTDSFSNVLCDVLPMDSIDNIIGPFSYTEYKYGERTIGIFGEYHNIDKPTKISKNTTLTFSGFISSLLTQSTIQYDLFVEMPYINKRLKGSRIHKSNTMLSIIQKNYKDCLSVVKHCPYKNLRAHYTDYRTSTSFEKSIVFKVYNELDLKKPFPKAIRDHEIFKNPILFYKREQTKVLGIFKDPKILKQLRNVPKNIDIKKFFLKSVKNMEREFKQFLKMYWSNVDPAIIINSLKTYSKFFSAIVSEFINFFIDLNNVVMDVYTISRMFRTFNRTPEEDPKNIIVYVGNNHAETYRHFMEYIKAKKIIDITGEKYITFSDTDKKQSFLYNRNF